MGPKISNDFDQFGVGLPCSTTYFLEVGARISFKLLTKGFLRSKTILKIRFSGCFSKA